MEGFNNAVNFTKRDFCPIIFLLAHREVRNMRWLAEATYTGEALSFSLNTTIRQMRPDNRVVIVLTDGRSDHFRDPTPLSTLCGQGILVSCWKCSPHVSTPFHRNTKENASSVVTSRSLGWAWPTGWIARPTPSRWTRWSVRATQGNRASRSSRTTMPCSSTTLSCGISHRRSAEVNKQICAIKRLFPSFPNKLTLFFSHLDKRCPDYKCPSKSVLLLQ